MADLKKNIIAHLKKSAEIKSATAEACASSALEAAEAIAKSLKDGGKLMLCGNGGSAADAQHIAAEFVSTLDHKHPRRGLAALALSTDTSFITAHSNDFGYEGIFERQVETLGKKDDVLMGISTSGASENILRALKMAREMEICTIALTGEGGGEMASLADILVAVPEQKTALIQESHITLGHAITEAVEALLFS